MRKILQRNFGHRCAGVTYLGRKDKYKPAQRVKKGGEYLYGKKDLQKSMRMHSDIECLYGHTLLPTSKFGLFRDEMKWFTVLREPVSRFLSHYQYGNPGPNPPSLHEWIKNRKSPIKDLQVLYLAGEYDLEKAKNVLVDQIDVVGITKELKKSMLIVNEELADGKLHLELPKRDNKSSEKKDRVESGNVRKKIENNIEDYRGVINEYNELDVELYRFAKDKIWSRQIEKYREEIFTNGEKTIKEKVCWGCTVRRYSHILWRRIIYKNGMRIRKLHNKKI